MEGTAVTPRTSLFDELDDSYFENIDTSSFLVRAEQIQSTVDEEEDYVESDEEDLLSQKDDEDDEENEENEVENELSATQMVVKNRMAVSRNDKAGLQNMDVKKANEIIYEVRIGSIPTL